MFSPSRGVGSVYSFCWGVMPGVTSDFGFEYSYAFPSGVTPDGTQKYKEISHAHSQSRLQFDMTIIMECF